MSLRKIELLSWRTVLPIILSRADPIRALVDETMAQPTKRQERRTTPRAMEPVEQVNPKSYIRLALKRLGKGKGPASSLESSSSTATLRLTWTPRPHLAAIRTTKFLVVIVILFVIWQA